MTKSKLIIQKCSSINKVNFQTSRKIHLPQKFTSPDNIQLAPTSQIFTKSYQSLSVPLKTKKIDMKCKATPCLQLSINFQNKACQYSKTSLKMHWLEVSNVKHKIQY